MHIHLDTLGGISGNMFVAALLDIWPEKAKELPEQMRLAGFQDLVEFSVEEKNDGILSGRFFLVRERAAKENSVQERSPEKENQHVHSDSVNNHSHHSHRHFGDIKKIISESKLSNNVKEIVLGIFSGLAEAEAKVHGQTVESVAFHEVGAWDSIADIVCAAHLISCAGEASWSMSSLPMGAGHVHCAHGVMPVPAPAVALLLQGFQLHQDGVEGERITPTGAAILRFLKPTQTQYNEGVVLKASGFGFGSRELIGVQGKISNVLRVLIFEKIVSEYQAWKSDKVLQLDFEIDDQTPEDLAVALDSLRSMDAILDVTQATAMGKKGRIGFSIQVLAKPEMQQEVISACFSETTTIGLRYQTAARAILNRKELEIEENDRLYCVKQVERPRQSTSKVAMDDIAKNTKGRHAREKLRSNIDRVVSDNEP